MRGQELVRELERLERLKEKLKYDSGREIEMQNRRFYLWLGYGPVHDAKTGKLVDWNVPKEATEWCLYLRHTTGKTPWQVFLEETEQ